MADTTIDPITTISRPATSSIRSRAGGTAVELAKQTRERWVEWIRALALAVFVAVPIIGFLYQQLAGRIVWTMVVAALPLFIVLVGYHRWRRICPLALAGRLPSILGIGGTRTVPEWVE